MVDAISADAFVYAGSVQVLVEVDVDGVLRTGGSLRANGSIRSGNAFWVALLFQPKASGDFTL